MAVSEAIQTAPVYQALAEVVAKHPAKTAIVFDGEQISYTTFLIMVDRAAAHFSRAGIGRGGVVAVCSQNRPEIMYAYYAAAKLGAVLVPVNAALTAEEVAYAVEHSGANVLYYDASMTETIWAAVDEDRIELIDALAEPLDGEREITAAEVRSEDDFLLIYTSGSTGAPKAVMLSQGGQCAAPEALARMWGVGADDVVLVALPLGFLYGLSTGCAVAFQSGATVVLQRRFHPGEALEGFVSENATVFQGVPTMYSMMLEYCEQQDIFFDLSGMRSLICAGAPLGPELAARFKDRFGNEIQNYYAMTEATPIFGRYREDPGPVPGMAIGKAAPGAEIRILRPDGTACADGEEGEILVRGASTLTRYVGNEVLTRESLVDGFFRSGDLGYRDANGFYFLTGRLKDIIIRGGANIAPAEVEAAIETHPAVQAAAVVGAADRIFGEVPVAFVVLASGRTATAEELEAHAAKRLAAFKVPRRILFEKAFPLGVTGKVDKAKLKTRLAEQAN
ncbi:class I adenylate-forming enzyme family protein [Defluviimonas sp. SAOS-178_SWC]|uniref:class I adenylate-forming enzyme family protein n=1 Tax=Defluviimonas sp. SAOS-178_SWC TaxID=3121287 RepID=UPI0032213EF8